MNQDFRWVIITGEGWGEGNLVAGVFDREPTKDELEQARKMNGAQFVRAEKYRVNTVMHPL